MFVRPCRSATIRTRLPVDEVTTRLSVLVNDPPPGGTSAFFAHGYFLGGSVDGSDFYLDYKFNSHKNPQTYGVHGKLQDARDWRILRLKLTARDPWLSRIELFFILMWIAFYVILGEMPPKGAFGILIFVMGIYATANLLYIPSLVTERVSALLASEVNGSIQMGGDWVVPR